MLTSMELSATFNQNEIRFLNFLYNTSEVSKELLKYMRTDPDYTTQTDIIAISVDSEQNSQKNLSYRKCAESVLTCNSQELSDTVFHAFFAINPAIQVIGSGLSMNNRISACLRIETKIGKCEDTALINVLSV
jgi:hypothetical protein